MFIVATSCFQKIGCATKNDWQQTAFSVSGSISPAINFKRNLKRHLLSQYWGNLENVGNFIFYDRNFQSYALKSSILLGLMPTYNTPPPHPLHMKSLLGMPLTSIYRDTSKPQQPNYTVRSSILLLQQTYFVVVTIFQQKFQVLFIVQFWFYLLCLSFSWTLPRPDSCTNWVCAWISPTLYYDNFPFKIRTVQHHSGTKIVLKRQR